jgi:hypothetical protein
VSTYEQRLKEAFDAVTLPPELKEHTLRTLAQRRQEEQAQEHAGAAVAEPGSQQPAGLTPQQDTATTGWHPRTKTRARRSLSILMRRGAVALAACLVLAALGFGGYGAYATETAVVGIEVNPSLELGINRFDIVVAARAHNTDGEAVLGEVAVVGKHYDEALALITESSAFQAFIDDTSFVDVSVICEDEAQSASLIRRGETRISELPCEGRSHRATPEARIEARSAGMGMGRYEAAQALMALDPRITLEACQQMTMRELRERIAKLDPSNPYSWHNVGTSGDSSPGGGGNGSGPSTSSGSGPGAGHGSGSGNRAA